MKSNSMLTATIMAMLALLFASATASPIMSVMDRISSEFGKESNDLLITAMKDIEINNRNMDDWWAKYNTQIAAFKQTINGKNIAKENKAADPLVCKKHEDLLKTLGDLKIQWGKVWSAWEAKNQLLNLIWGILNDNRPKNKNEAGLHCGASGQAGAAKELCDLLIKLRTKSKKEEAELKKEEITINTYIKNVTEYKCDCTFDDWDGDFGQCAGPKVEKVDIYKTCEKAETMKEAEGKLNCKPINSYCGEGTQSKTRTRRWDAKNGGEGEIGQKCKVGSFEDGVYSAVDQNEKQTFTVNCKAGDFDGRCPVNCEWTEWSNGGDVGTAACGAKSCSDNGQPNAKQVITRKKKTQRKDGGKYCFQDNKGHYDTNEQPCVFETTSSMAAVKLSAYVAKYQQLADTLKEEMCKGGNGPCGENGVCKVENDEDGKLTSWCKCKAGFKGPWCRQRQ